MFSKLLLIIAYSRGISTFDHYRKNLRPDVFKDMGGLLSEQGETWGKMRTIVNPIMLKPATANAYIPVIDTIAREFIDRIKTLRDDKQEMPANFGYELNKWVCFDEKRLDKTLNPYLFTVLVN